MPIGGGSRGELLAALLDNPPLVPLQLPNSWQGFAIAAVSHGFPSMLQMESLEHADFIPLSLVRAVPRVLDTPGQRAQLSTEVCGGCCCPKSHAGAGLQLSFLCFLATFRPEVQGKGARCTHTAPSPASSELGPQLLEGRIHLSAGFSLDPSLDLIRDSSW